MIGIPTKFDRAERKTHVFAHYLENNHGHSDSRLRG